MIIDKQREEELAKAYTLWDHVLKLSEELKELREVMPYAEIAPTASEVEEAARLNHLIEEMVDVGICLRRVEFALCRENRELQEVFQKFWEFKTLRQELRLAIKDETYGGKRQKV